MACRSQQEPAFVEVLGLMLGAHWIIGAQFPSLQSGLDVFVNPASYLDQPAKGPFGV